MSAQAHPTFAMRPFLPIDTPLLAEIFRLSIEELTGEDYNERQQEAWASAAADDATFAARLGGELTLIATLNGSPIGFAALKNNTHVDFLYVHPAVVGQGVGSMLVDALEKLAAARGAAKLTADVSDNAHDFFRKRGFADRQRNTVPLAGEWLANTTMEKPLAKSAGKAGAS
jgi:putative acetyltransferase